MAVKIAKKPVKAKAKTEENSESMQEALMQDMRDIVDDIAPTLKRIKELDAELKKLKPKVDEAKKDLLGLAKVYVNEDPAESVTVIAEKGSAEIGKESQSRTIVDKEFIIESLDKIEDGLAFQLAEFKLGDLDKYLTPQELEKGIKKEYSGTRTVKWG